MQYCDNFPHFSASSRDMAVFASSPLFIRLPSPFFRVSALLPLPLPLPSPHLHSHTLPVELIECSLEHRIKSLHLNPLFYFVFFFQSYQTADLKSLNILS